MSDAMNRGFKTFLLTDLVNSTGWKTTLGDREYAEKVLTPHNEIFRRLLAEFPTAKFANDTGDGYLIFFDSPSDAVAFAIRLHSALAHQDWNESIRRTGDVPSTRCGIHLGEFLTLPQIDDQEKVTGQAIDLAARVMGLALGAQTLLTRHAFDSARQYLRENPLGGDKPLSWVSHGQYRFKGNDDDPLEVFGVGIEGLLPMTAPLDGEKARRVVVNAEDDTGAWRPAVGLAIPRRDGWWLERQIGEGGFGEVWLARHQRTRETRVFKFCFNADRLRSFKRELTFFKLIRSELGDRSDIAKLYEVQVEAPPYFLESEYVPEGNLSKWAEQQGGIKLVPLATRLRIVAETARAVAAAHSLGIIHKDLKPSNILVSLDPQGQPHPILSDFGIGILADRTKLQEGNVTETGFTETLLAANDSSRTGTKLYSPPEAQLGKAATTATDVYALGVMLFQMTAGDLQAPLGVGWEQRFDLTDPHQNTLLHEDVRVATWATPESRLSSAAALAERLENLDDRVADLKTKEQEAIKLRQAEASRIRVRQLRRWLAAAGVLLLAVVGGIIGTTIGYYRADQAAEKERLAKVDEAQQRQRAETNETLAKERLVQVEAEKRIAQAVRDFLQHKLLRQTDVTMQANAILERGQSSSELKENPTIRELLDRAAVELEAGRIEANFPNQPLLQAELLQTVGDMYVAIGGKGNDHYTLAINFLQRVVDLRKKNLDVADTGVLAGMNSLANAYGCAGQPSKALPLLEEALRITKAKEGGRSPNTLTNMYNLASAYQAVGQIGKALPLLEETFRTRKDILGANHPNTLCTMTALANGYKDVGQLDKAFPLYEENLSLAKANLGSNHPYTLEVVNYIAMAYGDTGQLAKALPLLEETFRVRKDLLGGNHPCTLRSTNNLARIYQTAGHVAKAMPLFEETLKLQKAKWGVEHPDTLNSMNDLAGCFQSAGLVAKALSLFEETLKLRKATLDPDHPNLLASMNNLAGCYCVVGQFDKALPLMEETLKLSKSILGDGHPNTILGMGNLGKVYCETKQGDKAVPLLKMYIAGQRKQSPKDDPNFAGLLALVSVDLLKAGQSPTAEEMLRECLAIREKIQPDIWTTFNTHSLLGGALLGQKKYAEAEPLLLKGFEGMKARYEKIPGADAARVSMQQRLPEALDRLIQLYTETNKPDEVKKWQAEKDKLPKPAAVKP